MVPWWTLLLVAFVGFIVGGWRRMRQNVNLRNELDVATSARAASMASAGHVVLVGGSDDLRSLDPADLGAYASHLGAIARHDYHHDGGRDLAPGRRDADGLPGIGAAGAVSHDGGRLVTRGPTVDVWAKPLTLPHGREVTDL